MKTYIVLLCITALSLPQIAFSQQRIYLDKESKEVDSTAEYSRYFELTDQSNGWKYVKQYDNEHRLSSEGAYSVFSEDRRTAEGLHRNYRRETEELWYIEEYKSGELQKLESYYPGGKRKRQESYKNGKFKKGKCFTESGKKMPFTRFWTVPEFPGGEKDMLKYLSAKITYPVAARENNIQGVVILRFVVQKDGSVSDVEVVQGVGGGCTAEAQRVVESMPKWQPGRVDDEPIKVRFTLPVRFRLE